MNTPIDGTTDSSLAAISVLTLPTQMANKGSITASTQTTHEMMGLHAQGKSSYNQTDAHTTQSSNEQLHYIVVETPTAAYQYLAAMYLDLWHHVSFVTTLLLGGFGQQHDYENATSTFACSAGAAKNSSSACTYPGNRNCEFPTPITISIADALDYNGGGSSSAALNDYENQCETGMISPRVRCRKQKLKTNVGKNSPSSETVKLLSGPMHGFEILAPGESNDEAGPSGAPDDEHITQLAAAATYKQGCPKTANGNTQEDPFTIDVLEHELIGIFQRASEFSIDWGDLHNFGVQCTADELLHDMNLLCCMLCYCTPSASHVHLQRNGETCPYQVCLSCYVRIDEAAPPALRQQSCQTEGAQQEVSKCSDHDVRSSCCSDASQYQEESEGEPGEESEDPFGFDMKPLPPKEEHNDPFFGSRVFSPLQNCEGMVIRIYHGDDMSDRVYLVRLDSGQLEPFERDEIERYAFK